MKRNEPDVSMPPDGHAPADVETAPPNDDPAFLPEMFVVGAWGKPADARPDRFGKAHALLKRLGEVQSGILVAVGVFYLFGYISWSLYAWSNKLGLLPAVEAQYLIGGFFYATIIGLGVLLIVGALWLFNLVVKKIPSWPFDYNAELSGFKHRARSVLQISFLISAVIFFALVWFTGLLEGYPTMRSRLMWASGSIFFGFIFLSVTTDKPRRARDSLSAAFDGAFGPIFIGYLKFIIIVIGFFVVAYAVLQYSALPQSLGGFKARCARLDLDRSLVSGETLSALVPADQVSQAGATPQTVAAPAGGVPASPAAAPKPPSVLRSNAVQVLFYGNSSVILKADDNKVYEIERGVIKAVLWCD